MELQSNRSAAQRLEAALRSKNKATQEEEERLAFIAQFVRYDKNTGKCFNKKTGKEAGHKDQNGYIRIGINRKFNGKLWQARAYAHRLGWWLVHGSVPPMIDHINGNRADNKLANLRASDAKLNAQNKKPQKGTSSKYLGVTWRKNEKKWQGQTRIEDTLHYVGMFDCEHEAFREINDYRAAHGLEEHPMPTRDTYYIGVDPGSPLTLALISPKGNLIAKAEGDLLATKTGKYWTNSPELVYSMIDKWMHKVGNDIEFIIENVGPMPGEGIVSATRFVGSIWMMRSIAVTLGLRYHMVAPSKWKKHFGLDSDKEKSRAKALELFPKKAHLFRLKKSHNVAEAALLGKWGHEQ